MTFVVIDAENQVTEIDLVAEVWKCGRLPSIVAARRHRGLSGHKRPHLELRARKSYGLRGLAVYAEDLIRITASSHIFPIEQIEELVLHEMVHLAVGPKLGNGMVRLYTGDGYHDVHRKRSHHGPEFRALLLAAAFERWPAIRGAVKNRGRTYDIDERIWRRARDSV